MSDVLQPIGSIPLDRICQSPAPGSATKEDVVRLHDRDDRLYELVDRTLVEKTVGTYESYIAAVLVRMLGTHVAEHDLGIVLGADGMMQLEPGLVRIPDVSFVSWSRLPNRRIPDQAIADLVPDIAVAVISRGNTPEEMNRKLREYFQAGVRLVWYVYPEPREVHVFTGTEQFEVVTIDQYLTGGEILPGFTLRVGKVFA